MKLYVDSREKKLHSLLVAFNFYNQSDHDGDDTGNDDKVIKSKKSDGDLLLIESKQLELGDLVLCDNMDEILLVFERKSIDDLASSIRDGRYREQSSRLNKYSVHNHNIIYIIEGNIDRVHAKSKVQTSALRSAVVSLNLNKGFSTLKTVSVDDSARWILAYCYKVEKDKELNTKLHAMIHKGTSLLPSRMHISDVNNQLVEEADVICSTIISNVEKEAVTNVETENNSLQQTNDKHLEHLSKQAKSKHITKDNCQALMLSMIPYVSTSIANAILDEFGSIDKLMVALREDDKCLNNIKIKGNEKTRTIGKNVIQNIIKFLS